MPDLSNLWSTALLAGKWIFLGLIYLALFVVVAAVRQEMRQRYSSETTAPAAAGRLRVLQGGGDPRARPGQVFDLAPVSTLGAERDNTLVLGDPYISAHHARLTWDGSAWSVEDLGSANGTLVEARPCKPHTRCPVPYGSRLTLGDMVLELLE